MKNENLGCIMFQLLCIISKTFLLRKQHYNLTLSSLTYKKSQAGKSLKGFLSSPPTLQNPLSLALPPPSPPSSTNEDSKA